MHDDTARLPRATSDSNHGKVRAVVCLGRLPVLIPGQRRRAKVVGNQAI